MDNSEASLFYFCERKNETNKKNQYHLLETENKTKGNQLK